MNSRRDTLTPICGRPGVVRIEQLAEAAINQDALSLRSLTQDLLREGPTLRDFPRPMTVDFTMLAASAALIELFAERLHQEPPAWTREIRPFARTNIFGESGCNHETLESIMRAASSGTFAQTGILRTAQFS